MTATSADWQALQAAIAGGVIVPDAPDYESARKPAMARFDSIRPAAVVLCRTLPTSPPRSGSHGGSTYRRPSEAVGIRLSVAGEVATAGAGVRLGDSVSCMTRWLSTA
jgi:hypothetical protein